MKVLQIREGEITLRLSVDDAMVLSRACNTAADRLLDTTRRDELVAMEALQTALTALAAAGTAQYHAVDRTRCNREVAALMA